MSAVECPRVFQTVGDTPDSPLDAAATFRSAPKVIPENIPVKQAREEARCGAILSVPLPERPRAIDYLLSQCQPQNGYFGEGA
jgi:hypothetical protein